MYNWILYTGKDDSLGDPLGMTAAVVLRLVEQSAVWVTTFTWKLLHVSSTLLAPPVTGFEHVEILRLTRRGVLRRRR
ncbi:hypothetical protein GBAR_LOCUS10429 [Geodia barretti]|uniref:Uncharacterized protein n=1 Tax=Geodia barretti TaxID=519541 RepID=A0AA35WJW4_GEOBA|nr:hypothetical protein GBAR_LOCUS10429 [Geodia barretti]